MKEEVLNIGELSIDTRRMVVRRVGWEYEPLTRTEYELLLYLAKAQGRPVPSSELAGAISTKPAKPNTAEVYVKYVRSKLGRDSILSRRGFGYVLAGAAS